MPSHTQTHNGRDPPPAETHTKQLDSCKSHYGGAPRRERSKPLPTTGPTDNPYPTPPHAPKTETAPATPSPDPRVTRDGGLDKHPAPPAYPGSHRSTGGNANSSLFASRIPTQAPTEVGLWRCVGRSTRGHTRSRWSRV